MGRLNKSTYPQQIANFAYHLWHVKHTASIEWKLRAKDWTLIWLHKIY
jgi:hypothetical protein